MLVSKTLVIIVALCFVHQCVSKPTTEDGLTENRGVLNRIWTWLTSWIWWNSGAPEQQQIESQLTVQPAAEQLLGTTVSLDDNIEIGNSNVTIWCDNQTCTTMKCDGTQCKNTTCILYDTNLHGECQTYNILPEETSTEAVTKTPFEMKPTENLIPKEPSTEAVTKLPFETKPTETVQEISASSSDVTSDNPIVEEQVAGYKI